MEDNGRWSLLGGVVFLAVGINMLVKGIGPELHSYVIVVLVFTAATVWLGRYVIDRRAAKTAPPILDEA